MPNNKGEYDNSGYGCSSLLQHFHQAWKLPWGLHLGFSKVFVEPSDVCNCPEINRSVIKIRVITEERPDIIENIGLSSRAQVSRLSDGGHASLEPLWLQGPPARGDG